MHRWMSIWTQHLRHWRLISARAYPRMVEKVEVTGAEQAPIDFKLQVNFVDPAEGARRRLLDDAEPEADEKISGEPTEGDRLP
jgi:hypothetical protein